MTSSTPHGLTDSHNRSRSQSRLRAPTPPARPTTPLRPPSRSSLRSSYTPSHGPLLGSGDPIASLEPAFAELSDSMADLEANFMHLQLLHESLARFSECFSSFLYGLNVNAYCVDFTEAPVAESFQRAKNDPRFLQEQTVTNAPSSRYPRRTSYDAGHDGDHTFVSTDTSFVDNPPASAIKPSATAQAPPTTRRIASGSSYTRGRGASNAALGRGTLEQRSRGSGLSRGSARARGGIKR